MPGPSRCRRAALTAFAVFAFAAAAPFAATSAPTPSREDATPAVFDEAVDWLRSYLRIDTSNPPGNESQAATYLAAILHREGIATRLLVTPNGRTNLYARLSAAHPEGGPLVLLHHMDVVPAGEGWTHDPFSGEIARGRVWGRGAIDSKSLGISHLAALVDLERRDAELERDVIFLAVADEETGGSEGTAWLLEQHRELFADVEGVLNEGGSNRAAGDRLFWWGVEVAQKRPLWLRIGTQGRGGHGSTFNPHSAAHQLVASLANLFREPAELRLTPAAESYFRAIAPFHGDPFKRVFGSPDSATVAREFQSMLAEKRAAKVLLPGMSAFFQDTIQITSLRTPTDTINVVPAEASALLDIRLLPDTPLDVAMSRLREQLGPNPSVEVLLSSPPTAPSSTETAVFRALREVLEPSAPLVPAFITGTTDSRYFRERGVPAYGFSPFVLTGEEVRGIHGADESISVEKFRAGLATMRAVVRACVGG